MAPANRSIDGSRYQTREVSEDSPPLSSKPRGKQREPPPVLSLHPSPGASHVSLPGILAPGAPALGTSPGKRESSNASRIGAAIPNDLQQSGRAFQTAGSTRTADRTDALWAEMQATLEEVELSASGDTHVFNPGHDHKLAELRSAQIALAQAWARSEADDAIDTAIQDNSDSVMGDGARTLRGTRQDAIRPDLVEAVDPFKSNIRASNVRSESSGGGRPDGLESKLEEETELDILLARKRREANDHYFERVSKGVIDVVVKLEDVAVAMRAVEQESKDIWDENASSGDNGAN